MRDAGHRTPDAGHRTSDIGHRTAKKAKIIYPPPRGVDIITGKSRAQGKCDYNKLSIAYSFANNGYIYISLSY